MQSNMKFTAHIQRTLMTVNQPLVIIERALYWAPTNIEQLQDQAVRFIAGINGRDGVEDAKTRLGLISLHKRRRDQRLKLLMRILAKEEHHSSLSESYNEIMNQPATTMTMRSQTRGIPATFRTNNTQYHNSFLPRTIRDLKDQSEQHNGRC